MIEHLLEWCDKHSWLSNIRKKRVDQFSIYLSPSSIEYCSCRIEAEDDLIEYISYHDRNKDPPLISKFFFSVFFEKMIQEDCSNRDDSGKHHSFIPDHAREESYTYKRTEHPYIFSMIILDMQKLIDQIECKDKKQYSRREISIRTETMNKDKRQGSENISAYRCYKKISLSQKDTEQQEKREKIQQRLYDISKSVHESAIRQKEIRIRNSSEWISSVIGTEIIRTSLIQDQTLIAREYLGFDIPSSNSIFIERRHMRIDRKRHKDFDESIDSDSNQ